MLDNTIWWSPSTDATNAVYSGFIVAEEGTASSFRALAEVIDRHGLFCELCTDRGSHYFDTHKAGEAVSKSVQTQVGRALAQLGIRHIAAYSPEARGRSERGFRTLQDRLPKELALAGIRSQVRSGLAAGGNRWSHLPTESPFQRLFCRPELHRLKADPFRPQGSGRRAEIPLSSTVALLRTW